MDHHLINAYAHSNLHEALLAHLFADIIAKESEKVSPRHALQAFQNDVLHHIRIAVFPAQDENSHMIQQSSLDAASRFFRVVEDILVSRGVLDTN